MRIPVVIAMLGLGTAMGSAPAQGASPDLLGQTLTGITSTLGTYLAVLAGTSGLVVALIEAYKKLFSVRGKFHRVAVMRWLAQDTAAIPDALTVARPGLLSTLALGGAAHYAVPPTRAAHRAEVHGAPAPYDPAEAYAEFFHLTSGQAQPVRPHPSEARLRWRGVDRAVFELETSRMLAQIQDAADAVLANPDLHPHLYAFFTRGVSPTDAARWRAFVLDPPPGGPGKADSDRYARIRLLVRRQLDAFQTVTTCRWSDLNQWWAMVLGALILFVALVMAADPGFDEKDFNPIASWIAGWSALTAADTTSWLGLVLKAALGGALAPVAKDLLSGLSSIRFTR